MKVAFLTTLYAPYLFGGAEKAATLLAEALAAEGHEVCAITLHPKDTEEVEQVNGVRVYRLPLDNLYWPFQREREPKGWMKAVWHLRDIWNLRAARRVGRILDIERPDVVHSHTIAGFSAAALNQVKRRGIRLVHTMHDYYLICHRSSMFRGGAPCQSRCKDCATATIPRRWASNKIDAAIPVSHYLLGRHRREGYLEGTLAQVLPNINNFLGAEQLQSALPSRQNSPIIFGYIGRVEKPKGIEVLLEACSNLQGDWSLRVAGYAEPQYLDELHQRFPLANVEWLGFTKAREFYRSVDVCIVPSIWAEPQPYVVIEALDENRSLIVSNSGGLPEMAEFAAKCSVFPTGDAEALLAILRDAQANPAAWRQGGFRSQEIRDRFLTRNIVAAHERVYTGSQSDANQATLERSHARTEVR